MLVGHRSLGGFNVLDRLNGRVVAEREFDALTCQPSARLCVEPSVIRSELVPSAGVLWARCSMGDWIAQPLETGTFISEPTRDRSTRSAVAVGWFERLGFRRPRLMQRAFEIAEARVLSLTLIH